MAPKLFITGATGYIAGDALHALYDAHPDWDYTCLVRTQDKAEKVKKAYPSVSVVLGDLDASDVLEAQAAQADIVLHAADASDHEGAAKAIAAGLAKGHTKDSPGYWLHTGGTGILTYEDSRDDYKGLGKSNEKQYNDLSGIDELVNLPDQAFHRNVDKIVIDTGIKNSDNVKTVIVCPPTIYGKGRGPVSVRGRQVYELAKLVLESKYTPIIGDGKASWNSVHVADLSDVYLLLAEKAAKGDANEELWGEKGYIFTENGEHVWGDLARLIGQEAVRQGYISEAPEKPLGKDAAIEQAGFEAVSWGLNSRGKAERAKKFLRWSPSRQSIEEEVPDILKEENERIKGINV